VQVCTETGSLSGLLNAGTKKDLFSCPQVDRGFSLHSHTLLGLLFVRMLYLSLLGKDKIKKDPLFANHLSSISYPILRRDLYPQMFSSKHESQSLQHKSHPRRFPTHMLVSNISCATFSSSKRTKRYTNVCFLQ
jgi:hypothetical protein